MATQVITAGNTENPSALTVQSEAAFATLDAIVATDPVGFVYDDTQPHREVLEALGRIRDRIIEGNLP